MRHAIRVAFLAVGVVLWPGAARELFGQQPKPASQSGSAPHSACALVSVPEIRKITGREDYRDNPWATGAAEGVPAGGTGCVYEEEVTALDGPPMIAVVLFSGQDWTQRRRTVKLVGGCQREPVKEVGDHAFFESCPSDRPKRRTDPLYVKVGPNDLVIEMKVAPPATAASLRATVLAIARTAAAKLR